MKLLKRFFSLLLAVILALSMFACEDDGKGRDDGDGSTDRNEPKMQFVIGQEGVFAAYVPESWSIADGDYGDEYPDSFTAFSADEGLAAVFKYDASADAESAELIIKEILEDTEDDSDELVLLKAISSVTVGGKGAKSVDVKVSEGVGDVYFVRIVAHVDEKGGSYVFAFENSEPLKGEATFDFAPYESDIKSVLKSFVFGKKATLGYGTSRPDASADGVSEAESEDIPVAESQTPDRYSLDATYDIGPFTVRFPSAYTRVDEEKCMSQNGLEKLGADYEDADDGDTLDEFIYDMIKEAQSSGTVETAPTAMSMSGQRAYAVCVKHRSGDMTVNSVAAVTLVNGGFCMVSYSSATLDMDAVKSILSDILETVEFDETDVIPTTPDGMLLAENKNGYYTLYVPDTWVRSGDDSAVWMRPDGRSNVNVMYSSASGFDSLDSVATAARSELSAGMTSVYPDFALEPGNRSVILGGEKAIAFAYTMTVSGVEIYGIQTYCIKGPLVYCLTYTMTETAEDTFDDFEDILEEFRFG